MGRLRVLIVDDERLLREAMCDVLGDVHHVEGVGSVAAAHRRLADDTGDHFDLVLCDVQLPDGTAADVSTALRAATRMVLVTGGDEAEARRVGGDRPVLKKPFDLDELTALIETLLA